MKKPAEEKIPHRCRCDKCGGEMLYPAIKDPSPIANHIIGRSRIGGYLCRTCYASGETFDYRDKAARDFEESHRNDNWNVLLKFAYALNGADKADCVDFMQMLKAEARVSGGAFGKLPYDPSVRARDDYEPGMVG